MSDIYIDPHHLTHIWDLEVNLRRSAATYIVKSPMARSNYPVSPSCIPQGPEVAAATRLVVLLRPPPQQQTIASHCP